MKENNVAKALCIIGKLVIVCGVVFAFVLAVVLAMSGSDVSALICFVAILFSSIISGALFLGFAEVINLLQLNVFKTEKLIKTAERAKESNNSNS